MLNGVCVRWIPLHDDDVEDNESAVASPDAINRRVVVRLVHVRSDDEYPGIPGVTPPFTPQKREVSIVVCQVEYEVAEKAADLHEVQPQSQRPPPIQQRKLLT